MQTKEIKTNNGSVLKWVEKRKEQIKNERKIHLKKYYTFSIILLIINFISVALAVWGIIEIINYKNVHTNVDNFKIIMVLFDVLFIVIIFVLQLLIFLFRIKRRTAEYKKGEDKITIEIINFKNKQDVYKDIKKHIAIILLKKRTKIIKQNFVSKKIKNIKKEVENETT
ncbi:MAG: DUF4231 domain-containing protein [Mollicutes bacterium PWAP]|nr:DUF4231 domain-containing protein [Mollicutes bacterium PWAP]